MPQCSSICFTECGLYVADFMGNEESCVHALYWKAVAFALMMCDFVSQLYELRQKWNSVMSMVS